MSSRIIEVQGHRGARGQASENTLPSFELALDAGVHSIETDVLLTADDHPVLCHDFTLTRRVCATLAPDANMIVQSLTLAELRRHRVDCCITPLPIPVADRFAQERGINSYCIPTLAELFEFVQAYACSPQKSAAQREHARQVILDIELKRVPFHDADADAAKLENRVLAAIRQAGVVESTRVRSFDHRCVRTLKQLEPRLEGAILTHATVPAQIAPLLEAAQASLYCPDYLHVDEDIIQQTHAAGARIIPYTVNEPAVWERLIAWGVDGVTTDFPDRLKRWLDVYKHPPSRD